MVVSNVFKFNPYLGEDVHNLTSIFFSWVETTNQIVHVPVFLFGRISHLTCSVISITKLDLWNQRLLKLRYLGTYYNFRPYLEVGFSFCFTCCCFLTLVWNPDHWILPFWLQNMSFERFTNEVAVWFVYIRREQGGPLRVISWLITCNPSYPFIRSFMGFIWVYNPTCNDGFWAHLVPAALQALYQFYQRRLAEVASWVRFAGQASGCLGWFVGDEILPGYMGGL